MSIARILLAIPLAATVLTACDSKPETTGPVDLPIVETSLTSVKPVNVWEDFNGRVDPVEFVSVIPRVSGYIESVNFKDGQQVKRGDVLFTIDARDYRARAQQATAALARAIAQADQTRNEASRANILNEVQAISREVWEQRRAAAAQASADVQSAKAALVRAKLDVEWTQVRSPIDGRAGRARFTAGNLVKAGDAESVLTTLVSQDKVYVYFDVDETLYQRFAVLKSVSRAAAVRVGFSGEAGYPHEGRVSFVDNQIARTTGTISVRATLDNRPNTFTPGQFVRVQLQAGKALNAVLVDDKAVLTDQDRKYVYVIDTEGTAQRRDIQLGAMVEGLRIVSHGLNAGENVVISGTQRIFGPGTKVKVRAATQIQQASASSSTHHFIPN
ncbi:efflux RND transporter periplasmic adaptor subunit [Pantoea sp. Tr-811]|uniref:efflux RND transporter periplasmic adaptor subunit n=1 Tax=Pantoea sp. Tr-811 TaxID=2608361 RepID=UPI001963ECE6